MQADKGLIKIALEYFEKEDFTECLYSFEKYLGENVFEEEVISLYYYYMGIAAYRSSLFEKSSIYLDKANFDIEDESKLYYKVLHIRSLVYYYRNMIEESLECLKIIIEGKKRDETYMRALLNYGSFALNSDKQIHKEQSLKIFQTIISDTEITKGKLKEELIKELKSIAYYNLAQINLYNQDTESAILHYSKAVEFSEGKKPAIVLALIKTTNSDEDKYVLLNQLIDLVIAGKIKPIENDPEKPIDFSFDELKEVAIISYLSSKPDLFKKIIPALSLLGEKTISKHLFDLAIFSINKNTDLVTAIKLLNGIYDNFENDEFAIDNETRYNTLKLLAYFTRTLESTDKHIEYLNLFAKERLALVDYLDMEIFTNLIYSLSEKKKYQEALKYVNLINSLRPSVPEGNLINYLVIYHLELNIYFCLNNRQKAVQKAEEIILLANDEKVKLQNSNLLGETGLEVIRQNAESILNPTARVQTPVKTAKTYSRNQVIKVRYKDGTTLETKFKKVENDLKTGKCFILN